MGHPQAAWGGPSHPGSQAKREAGFAGAAGPQDAGGRCHPLGWVWPVKKSYEPRWVEKWGRKCWSWMAGNVRLQRKNSAARPREGLSRCLGGVMGGFQKLWRVCLHQKHVATAKVCHVLVHWCWAESRSQFFHFSLSLSLLFFL